MVSLDGRFSVDGCGLRYADSGESGTAVVLTHGAGADHQMFDALYGLLAAGGHRAVVWDLRWHGQSVPGGEPFTAVRAAADLRALIDHLGLCGPVLAGLSFGGNLAQHVVREDPSGYAGLVAMDCAWNTGPLRAHERHLLRLAAPILRLVPGRRLPHMMAKASAATDAARADAARAFAQMPRARFIEVWKATAALLAPDPDYRTPVPLCLISGALDGAGTIARSMPRWARTEGVAHHVVPGAGHLVSQDAPEATAAVVLAFLSGL